MSPRGRGLAVQRAIARMLRTRGYLVHEAAQALIWRGERRACPTCGRRHPGCASVPRSAGEDVWGVADLVAVSAERLLVLQCGGLGSEAAKRAALDAIAWPPGTRTIVVVRDRREGAGKCALRAWRRHPPHGSWTEIEPGRIG